MKFTYKIFPKYGNRLISRMNVDITFTSFHVWGGIYSFNVMRSLAKETQRKKNTLNIYICVVNMGNDEENMTGQQRI